MFLPSFVELPPVTFPGVPGIILVFPPTPVFPDSVIVLLYDFPVLSS